jgi:hypothetical protein
MDTQQLAWPRHKLELVAWKPLVLAFKIPVPALSFSFHLLASTITARARSSNSPSSQHHHLIHLATEFASSPRIAQAR